MRPIRTAPAVWELEGPTIIGPMISKIGGHVPLENPPEFLLIYAAALGFLFCRQYRGPMGMLTPAGMFCRGTSTGPPARRGDGLGWDISCGFGHLYSFQITLLHAIAIEPAPIWHATLSDSLSIWTS